MAQLGLTRTLLSCREYLNVLSLLFKVPFCKGHSRILILAGVLFRRLNSQGGS